MGQLSARRVVDTVLNARQANASNAEIFERLASLGVSPSDAPAMVECVEHGFQAGTVAVITGGASAAKARFGDNPVFDIAFRRGKAAMRFTSPGWVLLRLIGPWLLLAIIVGVLIYFAMA